MAEKRCRLPNYVFSKQKREELQRWGVQAPPSKLTKNSIQQQQNIPMDKLWPAQSPRYARVMSAADFSQTSSSPF